jgi:methylphosphotriester-DNA--protein-cysteine methyltransferase
MHHLSGHGKMDAKPADRELRAVRGVRTARVKRPRRGTVEDFTALGPTERNLARSAFLSRYRMLLAQRALRHSDTRIGTLAADLGYASEAAFSTAFKCEIGESPLHYRHRVRDELHGRRQPTPA